ncbi:MAG TPA: hypothetical protein VFV94_09990 [Polyangiaceae bacterium]|nr:hypothetical protein [Polyangiaceae bacterium]
MHVAAGCAGGGYRLVFRHGTAEPMTFLGQYVEVTPHSRLHPSKEALDAARASGVEEGMTEAHDQLDALLVTLR